MISHQLERRRYECNEKSNGENTTNNKLDERQARGTDAGHHSTKLMQFNQIKSTDRL